MSVPIRFAHISDTHVRPDCIEQSQVFADHLAEIQAGSYDFVIHTGDLMDEPSAWAARAFKAMISQLRVPIYFVPGNHDVYNPRMGEVESPWWARLEVDSSLEAQYRGWFGPAWHASSFRGVHLVGIDSLIINSGLSEEAEQWSWLEDTLAAKALQRLEQIVLFTHLPLFIRQPDEELDRADFANRYLVIAPPGRDRLLGLIRQYRVTVVLSGHLHAPWQRSHTWPEGFTTRFVCTGSSGKPSPMAIAQFDLPTSPEEGLGYHEHWVTEEGLTSRYHRHAPATGDGAWTLGPARTCLCRNGRLPTVREGKQWYEVAYRSISPEWCESAPAARLLLAGGDGGDLYVRQMFEAETKTADLYLELLTQRALELYLNGNLVCKLPTLIDRPPSWKSAGGAYTIRSPLLHLGLNQRLVRRGQNTLALRVERRSGQDLLDEEYIVFHHLCGDRRRDQHQTVGEACRQ